GGGEKRRPPSHLSLKKDAPIPRAVQAVGRILPTPILGGLHHQYVRIGFPTRTAVATLACRMAFGQVSVSRPSRISSPRFGGLDHGVPPLGQRSEWPGTAGSSHVARRNQDRTHALSDIKSSKGPLIERLAGRERACAAVAPI